MSRIDIAKKLFAIRGEVQKHEKVKPAGRNDFHNFDYLTPAQVLGIVNPLLEKYNLLVEFNIVGVQPFTSKKSVTRTDKDNNTTTTITDGSDFFARVNVTIADLETGTSDNTLVLHIPMDKVSPQGYGSILTYVERYFYMKTFGLATNSDDPDSKTQSKKQERPKI